MNTLQPTACSNYCAHGQCCKTHSDDLTTLPLMEMTVWSYLLTYLLTPWSRVLKKLTGFQLIKKFPAFYGNRRFITAFTNARHLSPSWASSIQSLPPPIPLPEYPFYYYLPIYALVSHCGLFPSGFPIKTLYAHRLYPIRATCPAHLILLDFITQTIFGEQDRSLSFSICSFLYSPVTLSLIGPNILLKTLFSNILSLRSTLNMGPSFTPIQNNWQKLWR